MPRVPWPGWLQRPRRRRRQIIVQRDLPPLTLLAIADAVQAAYPRAEVIVIRPGIFGEGTVVVPWDAAIRRHVDQLANEAIVRAGSRPP
jgi:hypothetical protein